MIKEQEKHFSDHWNEMRVNYVIFLEKGFSIKDIDLFLMQTITLVCAFIIEIKDTNINCSTSYPHGCLH